MNTKVLIGSFSRWIGIDRYRAEVSLQGILK